ncbi:MAG TPA: NAD-dependent epimerase/dehydratase family protein [Chloroflexota bacterium]|nr:NAD-dependent epimerase/dehydratase family protein [Chloroflexota bacterium]
MARILVTGARNEPGRTLALGLASTHRLRLVDDQPLGHLPIDVETLAGDIREPSFCEDVVQGVDVIVHLAPFSPKEDQRDDEIIDRATRGTYNLLLAAQRAGVTKIVLGSTLDLFERYPAEWDPHEEWRPRPALEARQISQFLAERSARELSRDSALRIVCLRFDHIVDEAAIAGAPFDPRWLHRADALQALQRALDFVPPAGGWWVFHITANGARTRFSARLAAATLGYQAEHDFHSFIKDVFTNHVPAAAQIRRGPPIASRPIRKVVVFGAGGPLGAVVAEKLVGDYQLRLTDVRPLGSFKTEGGQVHGAPIARPLPPPHENLIVDLTDWEQVRAACEGMDAIVNCSVIRNHPVEAFRVNLLGTYHMLRAAVEAGIRRVVHTGPMLHANRSPSGYSHDFDVPNDVPFRAGTFLYGHTKVLGYEVCRLFAEEYDLEIPLLMFSQFTDPTLPDLPRNAGSAHIVSWADAGRAVRRAVEVGRLPHPFEPISILADLPHGKYSNEKAKTVLGWYPRDSLARLWSKH